MKGMEMPRAANDNHTHEVSEEGLMALQLRIEEARAKSSATERAAAFHQLLEDCSGPLHALEEGEELSPEFEQLLRLIWQCHHLEDLNAQLEGVVARVA